MNQINQTFYQKYGKRTLDIIFAVILLAVFAIPMIIVAIAVKLNSQGPILFKHTRAGRNLRPFDFYKFRSMTIDTPILPTAELQNSKAHMTLTGRIIRKTSLDELPQLINVIKGDMSIVGPRPVILFETDLLVERQKYGANSCLPGITGLAQVNGRNDLVTIQKAKYDGQYVRNISFMNDLKILLLTVMTVVSAKGNRAPHEIQQQKTELMIQE